MNSFVFVHDIPAKIKDLFLAVEDLSSAWFDYCQAEPGMPVSEDFFQKIINVCETYDNLRMAEIKDHNYAALPLAAD